MEYSTKTGAARTTGLYKQLINIVLDIWAHDKNCLDIRKHIIVGFYVFLCDGHDGRDGRGNANRCGRYCGWCCYRSE
jgi:hypothetical protein